ncbi:hypothetical protein E4U21_006909 [Claviceps maximensis]|nr:hypothetical protein E4U21_006909 [Claviceps maximensis]
MAESGAAGYEVLTSTRQSDRLFNIDLDSGLGRKPSALPARLSQVLYVPKHSMLNLSLYDAQAQYHKAIDTSPLGSEHLIGRALMGSRLFKTRLNTMDRAMVVRLDAVRYVVDLDVERIRDGGDISATVRALVSSDHAGTERRNKALEINIMLPMLTDVFSLVVSRTDTDTKGEGETHQQHIAISTTYPLQRHKTNAGVIRFPYFGFSLDDDDDASVRYEWQIHPLDHGTLRYTLFQMRSHLLTGGAAPSQQQEQNAEIVAVYHHLGHDGSLFQPTSEGVLLLPRLEVDTSLLLEAVTVASLVGLLWRIRGMQIWQDESENSKQKGRSRSFVERIFGGRKM